MWEQRHMPCPGGGLYDAHPSMYQKNPTREPGIATAVAGQPRSVIAMTAL
jgi:hypothetical protein